MRSITGMITRAKVVAARMAARTLLQITALDGEVFSNVELLLPPGYVAMPVAGSDPLVLQVNGTRNHKVAIGGDSTVDALADLQPGEIGLSRAGQRVILRQGWIEIVSPTEIRLVAPLLHWSPDGGTFYRLATEAHVHGGVQVGGGETAMPVATAPGLSA